MHFFFHFTLFSFHQCFCFAGRSRSSPALQTLQLSVKYTQKRCFYRGDNEQNDCRFIEKWSKVLAKATARKKKLSRWFKSFILCTIYFGLVFKSETNKLKTSVISCFKTKINTKKIQMRKTFPWANRLIEMMNPPPKKNLLVRLQSFKFQYVLNANQVEQISG